jgi:hypothetical protein
MISVCIVSLFLLSGIVSATSVYKSNNNENFEWVFLEDYDPLLDINVTFDVLSIRSIDCIDFVSDADFFVKLYVNGEEFTSPVWENDSYLYDCWSKTVNVSDENYFVDFTVELWDFNKKGNLLCDLSGDEGRSANITYDIRTGRWFKDDSIGDPSGYGRLCGCDDGSIYELEFDCELWFNIYQNDFDGDGIPYYVEEYVYGTNSTIDDTGLDDDEDDIPIEWEHHWGYNPFIWEDHQNMDADIDSITNYEEYLTRNYFSDPFRKDLFLELDFMQAGPSGEENVVPLSADEILKNPFHRRNIVFHFDRNDKGGSPVPFDEDVSIGEVLEIYNEYFLENNPDNWRRSVFHYGLFVHECTPAGYGFSGDTSPYWGYVPGTNSFVISSRQMERTSKRAFKPQEYIYASAVMHEMGHNFGIRFGNPFGCDNRGCIYPWRLSFWLFRNYKSIMNYRYTYKILDYSDGSHGNRDFSDWDEIDFTYFERP